MPFEDMLGPGMLAVIGAFMAAAFFVVIVLYVYFALALMAIAKKTKTDNAWLAWIPFANIYLMTNVAKVEWWYALLIIFLPLIPLLGGIASMAVMIYVWWKIAEIIKKPGWWSILLLIPVVNLVIVGVMAWGK